MILLSRYPTPVGHVMKFTFESGPKVPKVKSHAPWLFEFLKWIRK